MALQQPLAGGGVRATRAADGPHLPRKTWTCAFKTFVELAAIHPDFEQNRGAGILRAVIWSSGTRNNQGWCFRSHHPALGSANTLRWSRHRACHRHWCTVARAYRGHTRTNESPGPGLQVPRIFAVIGAATDAWWPLPYQFSIKKRHFGAPRAVLECEGIWCIWCGICTPHSPPQAAVLLNTKGLPSGLDRTRGVVEH